MVTGRYLRTNYRLTGKEPDVEALQSILVNLRQTIELASDTGDCWTASLEGFGAPSWVRVFLASNHEPTIIQIYHVSVDYSTCGSIFYVSMHGRSYHISASLGDSVWESITFGSLAATISYPFRIVALIASR